jgi:DNA polymerase III subunit epsilon
MAREIVLDTETTGFKPEEGHRVIEIAAIEIVNLMPTGKHFRTLLNPERDIPADATRIHGFSNADVETAPLFAAMAPKLLEFLGDAPIIAHNAPFDFGFLDAELALAGLPPLDRARMIDTVPMARARFPGMPNSLDALCRRYGIDLSERTTHNALLDVRLLAQVYLELRGGRQPGLGLGTASGGQQLATEARRERTPRPIIVPPERAAAHEAFLGKLKEPIWKRGE